MSIVLSALTGMSHSAAAAAACSAAFVGCKQVMHLYSLYALSACTVLASLRGLLVAVSWHCVMTLTSVLLRLIAGHGILFTKLQSLGALPRSSL